MSTPDITADNLNEVMSFDHVVQVHPDGSVTDAPAEVHAPELHDEELSQPDSTQWTLLTGYTGQYGYNGPLMHPSEYIGGGLARDILAQPGYYVALVEHPANGEEADGWAVARMDAPADTQPITLDFATDASLAAAVAALDPDHRARLTAVVGDHATAEFDRTLIDLTRTTLAADFPNRTAIGVLFDPVLEDDTDSYFNNEAVALFTDSGVDFATFDDEVAQRLCERYSNAGRQGTVAVDLRGDGTVTFARSDRDIYAWFNVPRPT